MFNKTRIKYASRFGKLEHKSARWLGVGIVTSLLMLYFNVGEKYILWLAGINAFLWITYFLSHNAEKKLYPSNFR